jgi:hypothetical protein
LNPFSLPSIDLQADTGVDSQMRDEFSVKVGFVGADVSKPEQVRNMVNETQKVHSRKISKFYRRDFSLRIFFSFFSVSARLSERSISW